MSSRSLITKLSKISIGGDSILTDNQIRLSNGSIVSFPTENMTVATQKEVSKIQERLVHTDTIYKDTDFHAMNELKDNDDAKIYTTSTADVGFENIGVFTLWNEKYNQKQSNNAQFRIDTMKLTTNFQLFYGKSETPIASTDSESEGIEIPVVGGFLKSSNDHNGYFSSTINPPGISISIESGKIYLVQQEDNEETEEEKVELLDCELYVFIDVKNISSFEKVLNGI